MSRKTFIILTGLAILAFLLRSHLLPDNLFFGPEQGRDFKVIRDIVIDHKLTLIGSKTDISGIFHGPVYYYLAAIPFFLSRGDPNIVALFFIAIQSLTVFIVYLLAWELTGKRRAAYIGAVVYTVSFGAISYSRWVSNPPLTIPFSALFLLFVTLFLKEKKWCLVGAGISYALMGQAEFINYLLMAAAGVILIFYYYKNLIKSKVSFLLLVIVITAIFSIGNFILFDIRHGFLISKSILELLTGTKGYYISLLKSLTTTYNMFITSSANILGLPNSQVTAIVLFVIFSVLFFQITKQYVFVLLSYLITPVIMLIVLRHEVLEQLFVYAIVGELLGASIVIDLLWRKFGSIFGMGILICLIVTNVLLWKNALPTNYRIFFQSTQPHLRYRDQLNAINYIYNSAGKRPFYFQSYTIPYFWQDGWEYLFWFIGKKYGYQLPSEKSDEHLYVIIQKDKSNPGFQSGWYRNTVESWGTRKTNATYGELTVEERIKEGGYEK